MQLPTRSDISICATMVRGYAEIVGLHTYETVHSPLSVWRHCAARVRAFLRRCARRSCSRYLRHSISRVPHMAYTLIFLPFSPAPLTLHHLSSLSYHLSMRHIGLFSSDIFYFFFYLFFYFS